MRTLAAILVLLVLLAGCGGDDDSSGEDGGSSGSGYQVALPAGWFDGTERAEAVESPIRFDRVFAKKSENGFATNVNVIREPAPDGVGLEELKVQSERQIRGFGARNLTAPQDRQLDGGGAVGREYTLAAGSRTLRGRQVFSIHEGRIYTITFTALPDKFEEDQRGFEQILASWRWE